MNATGQLHTAIVILAYESEGSIARKVAFFPIDELDVGGQYRKLVLKHLQTENLFRLSIPTFGKI